MAAAPGLWSDEVACLQAALDTNAAAAAQSTFAVHQAQAADDHPIRGLDGSTADGHIAQAWLRSVASPCAPLNRSACPCALVAADSLFPPRPWPPQHDSHLLLSPRRHCKTHQPQLLQPICGAYSAHFPEARPAAPRGGHTST
jgi:hypothetical protein